MKNTGSLFLVILLLSVSGCQKNKSKAKNKSQVSSSIDIPTADGSISSFFDEELGEFALVDGIATKIDASTPKAGDFTWEDAEQKQFKVVYFDFDRYNIKDDQKNSVAHNVNEIKKSMEESEKRGVDPLVYIDGHADHSAGSATYNLALSEKRAAVLRDALVVKGIPKENIKIIGRGKEVPAMLNGKPVTGDRKEQWPNRRDEVRVMVG
ncbi:MAG: OmpA family protein [Candidatus Dependentiae bacterium]|nr:OmpA family protein [Candidatus Dependentiae bacterium]